MAKNKLVRSDNYNSIKSRAGRHKSALRKERAKAEERNPTLRVKRKRENVPITIEQKRLYDPARVTDSKEQVTQTDSTAIKSEPEEDDNEYDQIMSEGDDADIEIKNEGDESLCTEDGQRTLITTSPKPTQISYHFMTVLQSIFPLSDTIRRGNTAKYTIQEIAKYASNRGYQNLIVINEDRKQVNAIQFIKLPGGPTAYFTISSLQIKQLATHTTHHPELLLTNFTTHLGLSIAEIFKGLVPKQPHLQGRQTITLHNSRDFIFFRRHRYMFTGAADKVRLQEIGPRFTLKCREVVDGIGRVGAIIWKSDAGAESDRKRMFL